MNTKEIIQAIKFLRSHFRIGIYEKKSLEIISLLKQGEKYRQMWRKLKGRNMCISRPDGKYLDEEDFDELEQKYFPKKELSKNEILYEGRDYEGGNEDG